MQRALVFSGLAAMASIAPESAAQTPCRSLAEIIAVAQKRDPGVDIATAELEQARAELDGARAIRRPQVSAFVRTGLGDTGLTDSAIENQFGLRASQRIYDFGASRLSRAAEQETVAARQGFVDSSKLSAGLQAGISALGYLQASDQLDATAERERFFETELAAVTGLLSEGNATLSDVAEVAAELASARAARQELLSIRDRSAARVALAAPGEGELCKLQLQTGSSLDAPLDAAVEAEALLRVALTENPRIEALKRIADSLGVKSRLSERARLPAIDLVAIGSYTYNDLVEEFEFRDRIGIEVSVPLLTGSAIKSQARSAAAQASQARSEMRAAERQLEEDIYESVRSQMALSSQLVRLREVAVQRQAQFDMAVTEYDSGIKTLPDLIDVRLALEAARLDVIALQYDFEREALRLDALTGRLIEKGAGE